MARITAVSDSGPLMALATKSQLKEHLEETKRRKDIWISSRLSQKLIEALEAGVL
jgi:hypothetical protein